MPRVRIPIKTQSFTPLFLSRISWAIRVNARRIAASSRIIFPAVTRPPPSVRTKKGFPPAGQEAAVFDEAHAKYGPCQPHGTGFKGGFPSMDYLRQRARCQDGISSNPLQGLSPQLGEKPLHVLGQFRLQTDPLARPRVFKTENPGMKGLSPDRVAAFFRTVDEIPDERMTDILHVHPNLVGSPGQGGIRSG